MKAMRLSLPLAVLAVAAGSLALPIAAPQAPAPPAPPAAPALPPALPAGLPPALPAAPAPVPAPPAPPALPSPPAPLNQAAPPTPPTTPPSTGNQKTISPPPAKKPKSKKKSSRRDLGADAVPVDANSAIESVSGAVGTVTGVAGMVGSTVSKNGRRDVDHVVPAANHVAGTVNYAAFGRRSIKFVNHHGPGSIIVDRNLSPFGRLPIVDDAADSGIAPVQPVKNIPVEAVASHAPAPVPVAQPVVQNEAVPDAVGAIVLAQIE